MGARRRERAPRRVVPLPPPLGGVELTPERRDVQPGEIFLEPPAGGAEAAEAVDEARQTLGGRGGGRQQALAQGALELQHRGLVPPERGRAGVEGAREPIGDAAAQLAGEAREQILRQELALLEHLSQLGRGHPHRPGRDLECARQPFAELPAELLRRHDALRDDLLHRGQRTARALGR